MKFASGFRKLTAAFASLALVLAFMPAAALADGGLKLQGADDPYTILYSEDFGVEEVTTSSLYTFKFTDTVSVTGGSVIVSLQKLNDDASAFEDTGMSKTLEGYSIIYTNQEFSTEQFPEMTYDVFYRVVVTPASSSGSPNGQPMKYSNTFSLTEKVKEPDPEPEPEPPTGGGSTDQQTDSPAPGDSDAPTVESYTAPTITKFTVTAGMLNATANVQFDYGTKISDGWESTIYSAYVELYKNGKLASKKVVDYGTSATLSCPIRYGTKDKLYVKVYNYVDGKKCGKAAKSKTVKKKSTKIGKPTSVRATKISAKRAVVRWNSVYGATGYIVYKGSKKVKQVKSSASKYTVKGSGAGSAKYKVQAVLKSKLDKKTFKGSKSKAAKPGKNEVKWSVNTYYKDYPLMTCQFRISKISLSGSTYTITGYACNNRMWDMKKYEHLGIKITADNKTAVKKLLKNKAIGAKEYTVKKVTFKVKGKSGVDLRNGSASYSTYDVRPYWVTSTGSRVG